MEKEQWYSNKELFEMMTETTKEMTELRLEMKETKTLIRDYNGLREDIADNNVKVNKLEKQLEEMSNNRKEYMGYIIAAISTLFLILNYFK